MENPEIQKIGTLLERALFQPLVERMLSRGVPVEFVVELLDGFVGHNKIRTISKEWHQRGRAIAGKSQQDVSFEKMA